MEQEQIFEGCLQELLAVPDLYRMSRFCQHGDVSTLEHSVAVSYLSFRICRYLKWDYRAAARGGLLHDFFLYDWHEKRPGHFWHGFSHPGVAAQNAAAHFQIDAREQDIIKKHMWPMTVIPPRYKESAVVCLADKVSAVMEITGLFKGRWRDAVRKLIRTGKRAALPTQTA